MTLQEARSGVRLEAGGSLLSRAVQARGAALVARWPYAVIVVIAASVAYRNVANAPAFQNDEGVYTSQARAIWGGSLAPYTYWYDHPPFGWIQLALVGWIPTLLGLGGTAVGSMRYVVATYHVLNAVLLYALARRLGVRQIFAIVGAGLFVLSPLSLELGRQVLLDNLAMPWILAAFLLVLSPSRNLAAHVGAGVCFAAGVLSKETMAIYGPVLLYLLWRSSHQRTRSFSLLGFLTVGGLFLGAYPLMAALRGELFPRAGRSTLWDGVLFQFLQRKGSGFVWQQGSARADLINGWLFFDAYLILGGVAAALILGLVARTRWVTLVVLSFLLPLVATQGYLPSMYVVAGLPFLALAIAALADLVWTIATDRSGRWRFPVQAVLAGLMVALLYSVTMPSWQIHNTNTLTQPKNAEWVKTVTWLESNLSRREIVVVPPSMWQDLRDAGWPDQWSVLAIEKVDLDPVAFSRAHPGGWRDLDYVVVNKQVRADVKSLGLIELKQAIDAGIPVASFGETLILQVQR